MDCAVVTSWRDICRKHLSLQRPHASSCQASAGLCHAATVAAQGPTSHPAAYRYPCTAPPLHPCRHGRRGWTAGRLQRRPAIGTDGRDRDLTRSRLAARARPAKSWHQGTTSANIADARRAGRPGAQAPTHRRRARLATAASCVVPSIAAAAAVSALQPGAIEPSDGLQLPPHVAREPHAASVQAELPRPGLREAGAFPRLRSNVTQSRGKLPPRVPNATVHLASRPRVKEGALGGSKFLAFAACFRAGVIALTRGHTFVTLQRGRLVFAEQCNEAQ